MIFFNNEKKKADRLIKDFFNAFEDHVDIEAGDIFAQLIEMGKVVVEPLINAVSQKLSNSEFIDSIIVIAVFGELKDGRAVKTIIDIYKNRHSDYVTNILNETMVEALLNIGYPAVNPLIELSYNGNRNERCLATKILGKIGDVKAVEPLNRVLQNDSLPDVKFSAAEALERIGKPAVKPLINSLHNKDQMVRKYATDALGFIGNKRALNSLVSLLEDQDKEVREKTDKAIHRICQKCNLDYLQVIKESQIKIIKTIPEEKLNIDKPGDPLEKIKKLKELLDIGAITEKEFQMKKNKLMNKI
jgi:HEAT repeat protein